MRVDQDGFLATGAAATEDDFLLGVTEVKTAVAVFGHLDGRGYIEKVWHSKKDMHEWAGTISIGRRPLMSKQKGFEGSQFEFLM